MDNDIKEIISKGEDSFCEFKKTKIEDNKLARAICAFSNSQGGDIFFGVDDYANIIGLEDKIVREISNQLIHISKNIIEPPVYPIIKNVRIEDKIIIRINIKSSPSAPHLVSGACYIRMGASSTKASSNEIVRLAQKGHNFHFETMPTNILIQDNIKDALFKQYLEKQDIDREIDTILFNNLKFAKGDYLTNLGLLLFGKYPQNALPTSMIKAIHFNGNDKTATRTIDREDIIGCLKEQYRAGMIFLKRNLINKQIGSEFNQKGELEIREDCLSEALVNAIMHRDYLINSEIQIFIFTDRVEIISPGNLFNSLTIDNILSGVTEKRNQFLASSISYMLPFTGSGRGIMTIRKHYPNAEIIDDTENKRFKVIFYRH